MPGDVDFGVALAKYMVHKAASIVAHLGVLCVAICFLKCTSYSIHGDPSKSWLALTMDELYASRSLTCSGVRMATTLTSVLKHSTHSSMQVMFFFGLTFSDCSRASRIVGPGAPSRAGSSSCNSMYSPRQIFSAIFSGMGGETGPTEIALFVCGLSGSNDLRGVTRENCCSWTVPGGFVTVFSPANAIALGTLLIPPPPVGGVESPVVISAGLPYWPDTITLATVPLSIARRGESHPMHWPTPLHTPGPL